jgi:ribosome biogenesis protein Nip4
MLKTKSIEEFLKIFDVDISYVKKGKHYYLKNEELDFFLKNTNQDPFAISLILGSQETFFQPSLFLLESVSKKTKNKIFINDQAEWLFLCGRDVFMQSIEKNNSSNQVFLVQNFKDENLGLGFKTKFKGKPIIKNLMDRGDFLRREK